MQDLSPSQRASVTVCGWLLSVLRRTEGIQYAHVRRTKCTITNSCTMLVKDGLDGTLDYLLSMIEYSTVDEVVEHLGISIYGAKVLAKRDLLIMNMQQRNESCDAK